MKLTNHAIESMGFKPIAEGEPIEASFCSLHVFEVRGFTLKDGGALTHTAAVSGVQYRIGVGQSVNEACNALLGDVYTDDEDNWAKDHKCTPPYVIVLFGPTTQHRAMSGHAKAEGNQIVTYDAFPAAKEELRQFENAALPSLEMALACVLSARGHAVELLPVDRTAFGTTPANATVNDVRITGSGEAYVSKPLSSAELNAVLADAGTLAASLEPRVSRFFQLGMHDQDDLKKFLYCFLAVEIGVHRAFGKATKAQHLANAATINGRVDASVLQLLENRDNWTALADRFVWCVGSVWTHMGDSDIAEFKRLKRIRDDIAHGNIASPDAAAVKSIEALAKKIHQ